MWRWAAHAIAAAIKCLPFLQADLGSRPRLALKCHPTGPLPIRSPFGAFQLLTLSPAQLALPPPNSTYCVVSFFRSCCCPNFSNKDPTLTCTFQIVLFGLWNRRVHFRSVSWARSFLIAFVGLRRIDQLDISGSTAPGFFAFQLSLCPSRILS